MPKLPPGRRANISFRERCRYSPFLQFQFVLCPFKKLPTSARCILSKSESLLRCRFRLHRDLERVLFPVFRPKDLDACGTLVTDAVEMLLDLIDWQNALTRIESLRIIQLIFRQVFCSIDVKNKNLFRIELVYRLIRRPAGIKMISIDHITDAVA